MTTTKKTGRKLCTKADEAAVRKAVAEALGRGADDVNLWIDEEATPPVLDCIEVWMQSRRAPRGLSAKELDNLAALADLHPTRQGWAWAVEETGDAEAFKRDLTVKVFVEQPTVSEGARRTGVADIGAPFGASATAPLPMRAPSQPFEVWSEVTPDRGARFVISGEHVTYETFACRDALGAPVWGFCSLDQMKGTDRKGLVSALRAAGTMAEREELITVLRTHPRAAALLPWNDGPYPLIPAATRMVHALTEEVAALAEGRDRLANALELHGVSTWEHLLDAAARILRAKAATRTALEEQRDREEQRALAMIRDRRREGESEPDTLARLFVDIEEWPEVRTILRKVTGRGETLTDAARSLTFVQRQKFYPAIGEHTPKVVAALAGRPMHEAAAQLAHHIIEQEKNTILVPMPKSAAEWLRTACSKDLPGAAREKPLVDRVMDLIRHLAAERDVERELATLRGEAAGAWAKTVELLFPFALPPGPDGIETGLDTLERILTASMPATFAEVEEGTHIAVSDPPVAPGKEGSPQYWLDKLNRDLGTDFDDVNDVVSYIERIRAMHAASTAGGEYTWSNNHGHQRLYHHRGRLCYDGPGVAALRNNGANPYPKVRTILFDVDQLMLICQIVGIARSAEREVQQRALFEPPMDSSPFVLSLRGRALADAARLLAHRVNDCDAAADALHRLFPDQVRSYPGLADVAAAKIAALYKAASAELSQLRIERTNQSGRMGFLADALRGVTVALPATPTP